MDDDRILKELRDSAEHVEVPESLKPEAIRNRLTGQPEGKTVRRSEGQIEGQMTVEKEEGQKKQEEGRETGKRKVLPFRRVGAWAAAVLVLLAVGAAAGPVMRSTRVADMADTAESAVSAEDTGLAEDQLSAEDSELIDEAVEETAESSEATAEAAAADAGDADTAETETAGVRHIKDHQELYDMIREYEESRETTVIFDTGAVSGDSETGMIREYVTEEATVDTYGAAADAASGTGTASAESSSEAASGMGTDLAENSADVSSGTGTASAETTSETAAGDGTGYSETNVQEQGVDEADIVKTDGRYIYALAADGTIRIVDTEDLTLTGNVEPDEDTEGKIKEFYVDGDLLQVIASGYEYVSVNHEITMSDGSRTRAWYDIPVMRTTVITYDISDRSDPQKNGSYSQDGSYLTSRRAEDHLYLFTAYSPQTGGDPEVKEYYVPSVGGGLLPCEDIYLTTGGEDAAYSGQDYLVAGSVKDGDFSRAADRMAIVSGGEIFYVSRKNIYAAASSWNAGRQWTDLVCFGYGDGMFRTGKSTRLEGYLNDNFSMDEYEGYLRLVITSDLEETDEVDGFSTFRQTNSLYVLDGDLKTVGRIGDLAEGETIQSARFMGDTGYFVTYRNMDPLFSVDLSDPENPKILGELKITGFSAYLHFYGEDGLLGIGWETDPDTGERLGLKCSMFDLSDPSDVKETDKRIIGNVSYCRGLENYKAILADPEKNIFGFSYIMYEEETWEQHYCYGVFSYDRNSGFSALEYLEVSEEMADSYGGYISLRGIYVGDTFYLVGDSGVESYDMTDGFKKTGALYW